MNTGTFIDMINVFGLRSLAEMMFEHNCIDLTIGIGGLFTAFIRACSTLV